MDEIPFKYEKPARPLTSSTGEANLKSCILLFEGDRGRGYHLIFGVS
ncbi:MAG: hypothetical protein R6U17_08815 [Thermoplasmata archaeon]